MKAAFVITLLAPLAVLAHGSVDPRDSGDEYRSRLEGNAVEARGEVLESRDLLLEGRAACKNVGCKCQKNMGGVYCGMCQKNGKFVVTTLGSGSWDDVFQCSNSGACCDFGKANDCGNLGGKMRCG